VGSESCIRDRGASGDRIHGEIEGLAPVAITIGAAE